MKKNYVKSCFVLVVLLFLLTGSLKAQMNNCNGFLKGNYIEAGVNWNGAFGSSCRPPAGYHPQTTTSIHNLSTCSSAVYNDTSLGFVADPSKDGWATGTPPFFGDFILPGGPQEGWSYMADGVQYNAWNHDAISSDTLPGGLTSDIFAYSDTLGVKQISTQGIINGMYITQLISIDTGNLYISIEVILENTSLASIGSIYFMRTITPHNDQSFSGNANTNDKIEYTLPDSLNRTVVSSRGTSNNNAYLSLATQDTRAMGFISKTAALPNSTTIDNIYSGDASYLYGLNDSATGNNAMGIIFNIGILPSGQTAIINFIYAFSPSVIDSTLIVVDTINSVTNIIQQNYRLFPNPVSDRFTISGFTNQDVLELYDVVGRKIEGVFSGSGGNNFQLGNITPGTYILIVKGQEGYVKARFPIEKLDGIK